MAVVGFALLIGGGHGQPDLQAMHVRAAFPQRLWGALDMGDGTAGGHPADLAGADQLIRAEAVLVLQLPLEQVGEGGQADMRVLVDIHTAASRVGVFQNMVEEHERPDAAALG